MSTNGRAPTTNGTSTSHNNPQDPKHASSTMPEKSYFESQRELLVSEIAQSLEHVLQNVNKLNRSMEEVIAVGMEFSPVEALWSQFENVMAKEPEGTHESGNAEAQGGAREGDSDGSDGESGK